MSLNANHRWKTTRVGLSLIGLALALLIGVVNVLARRAAWHSETTPPKITNSISATSTQRRVADFESELITITPHGFEPQEITRSQGRILLMVDNQSDLPATSLQLTREAGPLVNEMRVPREQPNWSEAIDLRPGRYVLTESDHPDWQCRITITAR
jgi:hypothetical protein